jgi:hypothetical protein
VPSELRDCLVVADELVAAVDGRPLSPGAGAHLAGCLRCQAQSAQYRRLGRELAAFADEPIDVPPMLEHDIVVALDRYDERLLGRVPPRAAAAIGGIAAAAGVIALATRTVARQRRIAV